MIPLATRDLDYSREMPCNDCPFLRTSPFHEGVAGSLPEYILSIENGTFGHTCHKTDNRQEVDGPKRWKGTAQHCAGAILMLMKSEGSSWMQRSILEAHDAGKIDMVAWDKRAKECRDVFSLKEFLNFYRRHLEQRMKSAELKRRRRRRKQERARKRR